VLRSSVAAAQAFQGDVVGEVLDEASGERYPIRRFQSHTPRTATSGVIEAMPHWAGESVDGVKKLQPAAEIVQELAGDAEALLRHWR
jgi:nitronate monooxygenase